MASDDIQKRKELLAGESDLMNEIVKSAQTYKFVSNQAKDIKEDLLKNLAEEKDLTSKINDINTTIDELLKEQLDKGEDINQHYIDQLDNVKTILEEKQKQKDTEEKLKGLTEDVSDTLYGSLGTMGEMIKAGTLIGAGIVIAQKAAEFLGNVISNTVGLAKELYVNMGTSADEAGRLGAQTLAASFSIEGLLYGTEGLAQAAKDAGEYFGTTKSITGDMQKNVAALTALTGDAASSVKLNQIFADANGNAKEMTSEIKAIAYGAGVNANVLFKEMADSAGMLVGASKEELINLAKKTAELKQQGVSMKMMEQMSDNMVNLETQARAQMKLRAMGMGEYTASAAMAQDAAFEMKFGDEAKGMEMMTAAMKEANLSSEKFHDMSRAGRDALAATYGMSTDELSDMIVKQENFADLQAKNPGMNAKELQQLEEKKQAQQAMFAEIKSGAMSGGAAIATMVAQYALMNVMQGKGTGLSNLNPFSKGGGDSPMPEAPSGGGDGGGGILKSLGEGLDSLGKKPGKKLMGIVVLGALVAVMGASFAAAMYMLGDVDPVTMIAFSASIGILGATLALMGMISGNVIMGALALGIVAIALIPAAYAMSLLAGVEPASMFAFAGALTILSLAAAGLGFLAPFVIMGAAAVAILGAAIIPAATAFGMLEGLDTQVLISFSTGVGVLALATAGLGLLAPFIIMGAVALTVLGIALGPAAAAFGMLEGLDTQAIISFSTGIGILATTVAGLGFMSPFIILGAVALTALGVALGPISEGFSKLGQSDMGGMIESLITLGGVAPMLLGVGAGLVSIAAGLGMIALAGLAAMPGIGLLIALSAVAPALSGLAGAFGMGGGDSEAEAGGGDGDSELLAEIKGLRSDLQSQPIQIVMGNKVISEISKVQNAKSTRRVG